MTVRPPVFKSPGARSSTQSERSRKRAIDRWRGTAKQRGYDKHWRVVRKAFIEAHPLCQCDDCQGGKKRRTTATEVDHIIPISERPDLRLDWSNLRAMSKACHSRRTARDQGFARRR